MKRVLRKPGRWVEGQVVCAEGLQGGKGDSGRACASNSLIIDPPTTSPPPPMKTLKIFAILFGAMVSVLATGCLSPKIGKERSEHIPAPDPNVEPRLKSNPPADVLVIYDEQERQTGKRTRRAFYLFGGWEESAHAARKSMGSVDQCEAAKTSAIAIAEVLVSAWPDASNEIACMRKCLKCMQPASCPSVWFRGLNRRF